MKTLQSSFQIRKRDAFIHEQTFDLMKHGSVRRIGGIAPIHPARTDDAHRWLHLLHRADLHRRRMRTKHNIVGDVKRVLGIARGMAGGDIQCFEVVVRALDFGAVFDRVSHGHENIFDFLANYGERMPVPQPSSIARERDIQTVALESGVLLHVRKSRLQLFQRGFDLCL